MTERYPSEPELEFIKNFDCSRKDPYELVRFLEEIWAYHDEGFAFNKETGNLGLHTCGWSGNEDIIQALRQNLFWAVYWMKSERGGHHYFKVIRVRK